MDGKGGKMMCRLIGRMEKRGHYDVLNKRSMQKPGQYLVQIYQVRWIRNCMMTLK